IGRRASVGALGRGGEGAAGGEGLGVGESAVAALGLAGVGVAVAGGGVGLGSGVGASGAACPPPFDELMRGAPVGPNASSRSLITRNGRKWSRCWNRIHRSRSRSGE